jgi:putative membrane protein
MTRAAMPAVISAISVLAVGNAAFFLPIGPTSAHMLLHIALMNVLAPLLAGVLACSCPSPDRAAPVWLATIAQILLLWLWHAPFAHRAAAGSMWISFAMHSSLFLAALLFWLSLVILSARSSWQAIAALLVTGKLACLLGALLIFAPRPLYGAAQVEGHGAHALLEDQQLAGLYMVTACPLSFVLAAVIMVAHALNHVGGPAPCLAKHPT